jgi:Flp pilus assembly protein TadG
MTRNRQRGVTIPLLALFMLVLIGMMGLALDLGVLYTARTSAQHAVDSAALAGAFTYGNTTASNPTGTATAAAISAATKNEILGKTVPLSEVTVTPNPPYVTVSITHVEPTYFAKVMGKDQVTITAAATAQALSNPQGTSCLRPFWILRSTLGGCSSSPAAGQSISMHNPTNPNCAGAGSTPSQWGFINLQGGATAIQQSLQTCNVTVKCGDPMTAETGNVSSINHLDPTPEFFGPNPDYWYGVNDYALGGPNGPRSSTSESVITIAVVDDCNGQIPPQQGAQQTLNIMDFADIFIDGISGNGNGCKTPLTIKANLVKLNGCAAGGAGNSIGPYGPKVMLVQPPQ